MTTFVDDSKNYYSYTDPLVVRNVTQRKYEAIREYMNSNKLKINGDKSHLVVMTRGDGNGNERLLGGIIHKSGSWKILISEGKGSIVKQLIARTAALKNIARNADFHTRKMVAGDLIQAKLAYLLPLFGASQEYLINRLQVQQLAAARVVAGHACYMWSTERILKTVGWLSVKQLHKYSVLLLTHRTLTTGKPQGLHNMLVT